MNEQFPYEQQEGIYFIHTASAPNALKVFTEWDRVSATIDQILKEAPEPVVIAIDFDHANRRDYSSKSLGSIVAAYTKIVQQKKGFFSLCNVPTQLLEILHITRLDEVVPILEDRYAVIEKYKQE